LDIITKEKHTMDSNFKSGSASSKLGLSNHQRVIGWSDNPNLLAMTAKNLNQDNIAQILFITQLRCTKFIVYGVVLL